MSARGGKSPNIKGVEEELNALLGEPEKEEEVVFIPTGVLAIDGILGGIPVGHLTVISGEKNSGKTLLCLQAAKYAVKGGGYCFYFDCENVVTKDRIDSLSLSEDERSRFHRYTYYLAEDVLSATKNALRYIGEKGLTKSPSLMIIDSFAALLPAREEEVEKGGFERDTMAIMAKLTTLWAKGISLLLRRANTAMIITTQMRSVIDMRGIAMGLKPYLPRSVEHAARVMLRLHISSRDLPPHVAYTMDEKTLSLKAPYHEVTITYDKDHLRHSYSASAVFHYFTVPFAELGIPAGTIDTIYDILNYAVALQLVKWELKKGVGPIYTWEDKQFSLREAYYDFRELVLGEIKREVEEEQRQRILMGQMIRIKGRGLSHKGGEEET